MFDVEGRHCTCCTPWPTFSWSKFLKHWFIWKWKQAKKCVVWFLIKKCANIADVPGKFAWTRTAATWSFLYLFMICSSRTCYKNKDIQEQYISNWKARTTYSYRLIASFLKVLILCSLSRETSTLYLDVDCVVGRFSEIIFDEDDDLNCGGYDDTVDAHRKVNTAANGRRTAMKRMVVGGVHVLRPVRIDEPGRGPAVSQPLSTRYGVRRSEQSGCLIKHRDLLLVMSWILDRKLEYPTTTIDIRVISIMLFNIVRNGLWADGPYCLKFF